MTAIEERPAMIELRAVSKRFDGRRAVVALDGVDLAIGRGEFVSIVGPSGSGKSTLLNLMGVLDRPSSGDVLIDGQPLAALGDRDRTYVRRDKIGFIFQFFNLLPSLSAAQNVALPLHLRHWSRRKADDRARELLAMVGLEKRADHQPDELSGGERQRVAIARALSVNPPILLGDEPTGHACQTCAGLWSRRGQLTATRQRHARVVTTHNRATHRATSGAASQAT